MAVLCRGLEKNGMVVAGYGRGKASVKQTQPHCLNQMEKTHSKPLAAQHGSGTAWARHAMCESAFNEFSQSALFFLTSFQFLIFHLLIMFVQISTICCLVVLLVGISSISCYKTIKLKNAIIMLWTLCTLL
jgi:hypothetical protein